MWEFYGETSQRWLPILDAKTREDAIKAIQWSQAHTSQVKIREVQLVPVEGSEELVSTNWTE